MKNLFNINKVADTYNTEDPLSSSFYENAVSTGNTIPYSMHFESCKISIRGNVVRVTANVASEGNIFFDINLTPEQLKELQEQIHNSLNSGGI